MRPAAGAAGRRRRRRPGPGARRPGSRPRAARRARRAAAPTARGWWRAPAPRVIDGRLIGILALVLLVPLGARARRRGRDAASSR
jgi:hypothetical protein